jgi:hypothetical protein
MTGCYLGAPALVEKGRKLEDYDIVDSKYKE